MDAWISLHTLMYTVYSILLRLRPGHCHKFQRLVSEPTGQRNDQQRGQAHATSCTAHSQVAASGVMSGGRFLATECNRHFSVLESRSACLLCQVLTWRESSTRQLFEASDKVIKILCQTSPCSQPISGSTESSLTFAFLATRPLDILPKGTCCEVLKMRHLSGRPLKTCDFLISKLAQLRHHHPRCLTLPCPERVQLPMAFAWRPVQWTSQSLGPRSLRQIVAAGWVISSLST